jgi:putative glycosyltransferase (TIGR04348 family)
MRICIACPAPPRSRKGNRVTALRWARILNRLGHRVTIGPADEAPACDLLVALHARRSYEAARQFRQRYPQRPLLVALTGTDLYRDIRTSRHAQQSLEMADRLLVLQPCARAELPAPLQAKVRVLYQSVRPTPGPHRKSRRFFVISVLGHLRYEKDPFRAALALRLLQGHGHLLILQAGQALSPGMEQRARALAARDTRYRWVGEVPRYRARRLLARSDLLVLSSRMEGGANVISEAVVDGVPVLASRIPGSVGLLGERYPGYFPVGDTRALAGLLARAASDTAFYHSLETWCRKLASLFRPARERAAWRDLLGEFAGGRLQ